MISSFESGEQKMQMRLENLLNNSIVFLSFLALIFMPFDSIPDLFPSIYRPLSLIFILLASPLIALKYCFNFKWYFLFVFIEKYTVILLFLLYTVPLSYYFTNHNNLPFTGSNDFTLTLLLGIFTFIVFTEFNTILLEKFRNNRVLIEYIFTFISIVYLPVLIFGMMELLVVFGIMPIEIKHFLISWAVPTVHDRIQLLSGEASWATMHLIFIIPIYFYLSKLYKWYFIPLLVTILLLLFTFSLQGILTLMIALFVLFIIYFKKIKPIYFIVFIGLLITLLLIWLFIKDRYSNIYFVTRFYRLLEINNIKDILHIDGSVFVRLAYPSIAILLGLNFPLFGVGGGNYRYYFEEYLFRHFIEGIRYEEVYANLTSQTSNPKNFFARLLGETGLVGTGIFMFFLITILLKINFVKSDIRPYLIIWIVFVLANMMQFDSFVYVHLWIVVSVVFSLKQEYEYEKYID